MPSDLALAAATLAGLAALCGALPGLVRRALLDGLRCLGRYPALWRIPALLATGYAAFQLLAETLLHVRMGDAATWLLDFAWNPAPAALSLLAAGALPAADRTASVFTLFTATFPLSWCLAVALLANRHGLFREMIAALRRHAGNASSVALSAALMLAALCAVAKPFVYLFHPEIVEHVPFAAEIAVDLLSTIFELLLGIFLLTCLMLLADAWRRGLHCDRTKLLHVAMRRSGYVLKWSLLLAALSLLLVQLPLQLAALLAPGSDIDAACAWFSEWIGHAVVIAFILLHCPVQAILVFHNESLREALRDGRHMLRTSWATMLPFLAMAFLLFLLLLSASDLLATCLGSETPAAFVARILSAWIEAALAGWLVASWVCLYKSLSSGRKEIPF